MIEPALRRRRLTPYPWFWDYLAGRPRARAAARRVRGPTHIVFLFVDHYEPETPEMVARWVDGYPALAAGHQDADGRPPQYGWFWYFPQASPETEARYLQALAALPFGGWGEIDLHLHHEHDTAETLTRDLERRLALSHQFGAMCTAEPVPRAAYGFIHGMWALDNSRLGAYCGVNNELQVLNRTGCYADFTMAAWGPMQSRWVNRIYMATDDPARPKSYDTGVPVRVGRRPEGDLLLVQGPTVLHWAQAWKRRRPVYDHGDITRIEPPAPWRTDRWVQQHIHVEGRPEWVFVKAYTHGAVPRDVDTLLGPETGALFADLERRYNDGTRYQLHYVTAREAYNIVQAAADGRGGNPHQYRDYRIPPPAGRFLHASGPVQYRMVDPGRAFSVDGHGAGLTTLRTNAWTLRAVTGPWAAVTWREDASRQGTLTLRAAGEVRCDFAVPVTPSEAARAVVDGCALRVHPNGGQPTTVAVRW